MNELPITTMNEFDGSAKPTMFLDSDGEGYSSSLIVDEEREELLLIFETMDERVVLPLHINWIERVRGIKVVRDFYTNLQEITDKD
jgi:hypothetical protein